MPNKINKPRNTKDNDETTNEKYVDSIDLPQDENNMETNDEIPIPDDDQTRAAVDEIVEKESDTVLQKEDEEIQAAFSKKPKEWKDKIKDLFHRWWDNKKVRYWTFAGLGVFVFLLGALPVTRYFLLNAFGVRASSSITIFDDSTHLPLKNVEVTIGKQSAKTDSSGKAELKHIKLGRQQLIVKKRAYAELNKKITVGWGSNPLGNADIKAVGAQYSFIIRDWLSGKPIADAEATSGEFDAISDKEGKLILIVDANNSEDLQININADGYREEKVQMDADNKSSQDVQLVAGRKQAFITKRSGKYDLYKVDVDGRNEELVLKGSGNENENIGLVMHAEDEVTALVSTRDNVRNKDGYLLSTLTIVDLTDNSTKSVVQSEEINILGWSDDKLVFAQIAAGTSAGNPKRQRLMSYDYKTQSQKELTSSNAFTDLMLIGNTAYFAETNYYQPNSTTNGFYKQNVDSPSPTRLLDKEVWNIFRTSYDTLDISAGQEWYQHKIGDTKVNKQPNAPASLKNRIYNDNLDKSGSLWVDDRDGKGVLILRQQDQDEKVLKSQAGLSTPVRWLNKNTIIYRIYTQQEIADYVMNIDGGDAKKIRDVTDTYGIYRWNH